MAGIDWLKIKNEYIHTDTSYRKLAEKHKVSFATLQARAKREGWAAEREAQYDKIKTAVGQKTAAVIVAKEVNRIERINGLADQLIAKLETATSQLDQIIVANKLKSKTVVYSKSGRPVSEVSSEQIQPVAKDCGGLIDRRGLKALTAALKDLHSMTDTATSDNGALNELIRGLKDGGIQ